MRFAIIHPPDSINWIHKSRKSLLFLRKPIFKQVGMAIAFQHDRYALE
jgi:hypothetical protein